MENGGYYEGSDLKFQIGVSVNGFDQNKDDYTIDIYCGEKQVATFTQDDVKSSDGKFYLPVPSDVLEPGPLKIVVTAFVPDSDFDSGVRKEVAVRNLKYMKRIF